MFYLVRTAAWLRALYPTLTWRIPTKEKILYLTFDDGPHETATTFVLDQLKTYNAKASFFCIGKNVTEQADIYRRILEEGHITGNHTQNHLNGWKTDNETYFNNIFEAAKYIDSHLFRPPYGKITRFQAKLLQRPTANKTIGHQPFRVIMWDVLSGDFDHSITKEKCLQNVLLNTKPGSVIVFHDSTKAFERMSYALPLVLQHFTQQGYRFASLPV